jgi:hypothetical protein
LPLCKRLCKSIEMKSIESSQTAEIAPSEGGDPFKPKSVA